MKPSTRTRSQRDAVECYFIEAANSLDDTTNERAFLLGAQEHFNHADEGGFYVTQRHVNFALVYKGNRHLS